MELSPEDQKNMLVFNVRFNAGWIVRFQKLSYSTERVFCKSGGEKSLYGSLRWLVAKGGTVYVDGSRDSQVLTLEAIDNEINTQVEPAEDQFTTQTNEPVDFW